MKNKFRKADRIRLINELNDDFLPEILGVTRLQEEPGAGAVSVRVNMVDKYGLTVLAIRRNGEIGEVRIPFRRKAHTPGEAWKELRKLFQM